MVLLEVLLRYSAWTRAIATRMESLASLPRSQAVDYDVCIETQITQ